MVALAGRCPWTLLACIKMKVENVQLNAVGLKETKPDEWLIRFVFGGLVSLATGMVGLQWGPVVGGLFLGFPSILPATVTLVTRYEGRAAAANDARGAAMGSIGLIAFAVIAYVTAESWPAAVSLGAATCGWAVVATAVSRFVA